MSLIFGINLSDRIYLASDCRVSYFKNNDNKPYKTIDCINKTEPLNDLVSVSAAGDTKLCKYLFPELKKEKFVEKGINSIRDNIESWTAKKVDEYLRSGNEYCTACLLFGGIDKSKNKVINGRKLIQLVKNFQDLSRNQQSMAMKKAIFDGLASKPNQPNPFPVLPVSDSKIFGVLSDAKKSFLKIEDTEWGQFLTYGPKGFKKEYVPKTILGQLEFEQNCGDKDHDRSILTAFIKESSRKYSLDTVGGSIIVAIVSDFTGSAIIAGNVWIKNISTGEEKLISSIEVIKGKLHGRTESGIITELIPFFQFNNVKKTGYSII